MQDRTRRTLVDRVEEGLLVFLLGAMTLLTFANVIARKVFNSNILWAVELTVFLFAWLVLLGASYAVRKNSHLGVDALTRAVSAPARRLLALASAGLCVVFSLLLLKGAWDYWANFANLPATTGRWLPFGLEDDFLAKGWYEVDDIPHPAILGWMADAFNEGEAYDKLPRLVPYVVLPVSMALLLYRFLRVCVAVWLGKVDSIVAGHEVEGSKSEAGARG